MADAKEERITVVVREHLDPVVILISNQHAVRRRFDRPGPVELAVRIPCSTGTDRTQRRAVGGEHIDPVMALVRNEYVTRRVDRHTNRPLKSGDHVGPAEHVGVGSVGLERLNSVVERVRDDHAAVERIECDTIRKVETTGRGAETAKGARRQRLIPAIEYLDPMVVAVRHEDIAGDRIDRDVVGERELPRQLGQEVRRVRIRVPRACADALRPLRARRNRVAVRVHPIQLPVAAEGGLHRANKRRRMQRRRACHGQDAQQRQRDRSHAQENRRGAEWFVQHVIDQRLQGRAIRPKMSVSVVPIFGYKIALLNDSPIYRQGHRTL